mmetsp:Transcript_40809/g.36012  ORF Transcript_40809/g.36012 Transcript_40809/m.36012 type:complete len:287 (-) Transcript_40809:53-913(-)
MALTGYKAFWDASKLILGINAVGFGITAMTRTHKITDLVGVGTFGIAACYTLYRAKNSDKTKRMLTLCVCLWSLRLSSFLFLRVLKAGEDKRLHQFFPNPNKPDQGWFTMKNGKPPKILKLAFFWSLQALWCILVLSPVNMANLHGKSLPGISKLTWIGFAAFLFFLGYESMADLQKFLFKENPANVGKFCDIGLYQYSKFPNYCGEMGVWFSLFLMASPILKPAHYWTVISPLFTLFLLNNVSGVPFLMSGWNKRYGDNKVYLEWKEKTNKYFPSFSYVNSKKEL